MGEEDKREVHFLPNLVGASQSCQEPRRGPEVGTRLTMGKGYSSPCKGHWLTMTTGNLGSFNHSASAPLHVNGVTAALPCRMAAGDKVRV